MPHDWETRHWTAVFRRAWGLYRSTRLPGFRSYAARQVRFAIEMIRAAEARRHTNRYRRPAWWDYSPEKAA